MAVTILQSSGTTPVQSGPGTTTLTCTLPDAPTVGNLLVFLMAGDGATGALTLPGFTQQHVLLGSDVGDPDVALYMAYRTSDGTETSISPVWDNPSIAGNTAWYAELEDTAITGSTYWQVSASASMPYSADLVQARSTNTTGLSTHAGLAIGAWGVDNGGSVGLGARAYSNAYTERCTSHTAVARGGIFAASKNVAAGATTESTFSYSGFGIITDQVSGCVAVFSKLVEAKGNVSVTVSHVGGLTATVAGVGSAGGSVEAVGGIVGTVAGVGGLVDSVATTGGLEDEVS